MTLEQAKKFIEELDPGVEEGSDTWIAYLILLGSISLGPNIKKLSKWSRVPRERIAPFSRRLRENGIWVGGRLYVSWDDTVEGTMEFTLDAAVACGYLTRTIRN